MTTKKPKAKRRKNPAAVALGKRRAKTADYSAMGKKGMASRWGNRKKVKNPT